MRGPFSRRAAAGAAAALASLLVMLPITPGAAVARGVERQLDELVDFRKVIDAAKGKVFPAVVFIKCVSENYDQRKKVTVESSGSGVLISPTGELLTNWHVVDKAVEVRCLLYDGRPLDAKVVGTDKDTDLALVQLQLPPGESAPLPYAKIGDSTKLSEGHFVMAMGAPWGLSRSISMGIVSCTRRFLPDISEYSLWLQTDAAISPGNSGGPLVNTDGEVIGINARGMMAMAGGDMGFAIPSETALEIVNQIRERGKVDWSWTGLQLQPIRDFNRDIYFEGTEGVIVADTDPESPARQAGLQPRDRILTVNGKAADALMEEDLPAVRRMLGLLPKNSPATLVVLRDGEKQTVQLTPREKGKVQGEELDLPRWDLTVKAINQFENPDLYFHRKEGVFVHGVRSPGNAQNAGLQNQDILLKVDGKDVRGLDDVRAIHKSSLAADEAAAEPGEPEANADDGDHRVLLTVLRNGLMKQVVLDYSRDHSKE